MNRPRAWSGQASLRRGLAALALIALALRAVVPTGFMPVLVHGQTQLMFCDTAMAGAAHHGHHQHGGSSTRADAPCPFAISGGAAPLPAAIDFSLNDAAPVPAAPFVLHTALPQAPARHSAPRGPPSLA